jgi:hypothetical protein
MVALILEFLAWILDITSIFYLLRPIGKLLIIQNVIGQFKSVLN